MTVQALNLLHCSKAKVDRMLISAPRHECIVEWNHSYTHSLSRHYIKVSGQFHVLTALPHPEAPGTYPIIGCLGHRPEEGVLEKK